MTVRDPTRPWNHRPPAGPFTGGVPQGPIEAAGQSFDPGRAPTSLTYTSSSVTWQRNVAITPLSATTTGQQPALFTAVPPLPTGVKINATGYISGTPTVTQAATQHRIMAWFGGLAASFYLTVTVNP